MKADLSTFTGGNQDKIRVYSTSKIINDAEAFAWRLGLENASIKARLLYDENNPQYVLADHTIYYRIECFSDFLRFFNNPKIVLIFFSDEAIASDYNIFDYCIGNEQNFANYDRIASVLNFSLNLRRIKRKNTLTKHEAAKLLPQKKFCNFIYSNSNAHPMRDAIFYKISEYKRVDSLGGHLNNCSNVRTRSNNNWEDLSVEMKQAYKFSIACENADFDGYTTEKMLTSFDARTVPIYWGNKFVEEYFNPKAFINCHNYSSLNEVLERVKEIDANDDLWCEMVSQDWQTPEQYKKTELETQKYQEFLTKIFTLPLKDAIRRPIGSACNLYRRWWKRDFLSPLGRVKDALSEGIKKFCVHTLGDNNFYKLMQVGYKIKRKVTKSFRT